MSRVALSVIVLLLQACSGASTGSGGAAQPAQPAPVATAPDDLQSENDVDEQLGPDEDDGLEEEEEAEEAPPPASPPPPHPLVDKTDAELEAMLLEGASALGPISLGRPSSGAQFNAVPMPKGPQWKIVNPRETWGTQETVDAIARIIGKVNEQFPNTQPIYIGDISTKKGGYLRPHISHQSGRDVDIGYYYTKQHVWYETANASNLDLPRSWAFVRAMITETDVQRIFIDRAIQPLLKNYALSIGEDATWLDSIFGGPLSNDRPLIMHEDGHKSHIHIRFFSPIAQETGRRMYRLLIKHKKISPPTYYIKYKVRRGDNLGRIAKRYKTTVKALKRANGLRSSRIYAGRTYKIPRRGGVKQPRPLVLPARRLPPSGSSRAAAAPASPQP